MFKNYLKTAWRHLRKNKLYAAINIFGLSAGLAACLLIGVYINHELSYDRFHVNAARIARATMEYNQAGTVSATANTGTKVGPQFMRMFPSVELYVRTYIGSSVVKRNEKIFDEPRVLFADEHFFKMFSFPLLAGSAASVLDAPDKVVITASMAKKYFGDEDPVQKTITLLGRDFTVSGVCSDIPENSQLKFDFVTQFLNLSHVKEETWWNANWITYFLLHDENDLPHLQQQVNDYMQSAELKKEIGLKGNDYLAFHLEPLLKVHLYSPLAGFEPNGSITYIYLFSMIALLILVIACANYTNLATAQAAGRSGEIGIRKVTGASKTQVFVQFMGESVLITLIAAVIAFATSLWLIPFFNLLAGKQFSSATLLQPFPVAALILSALVVSFFAGLYPALLLSGAQVMGVIRKGFAFTGGNNMLRKVLIVMQFGISVFLIIYTIIILQQMNFLRTKNLGYTKDHVLVLPIGGKMLADFENIKSGLSQVNGVEAVTASYETPEFVEWGDGIVAMDEKGKHEVSLNAMPVDLDFIKTMQMELAAGRDFQLSDFAMMDTAHDYANFQQPYIINEALAAKIGWKPEESIGRTLEKNAKGPVVGVVKDFNFSSLREPIGPLLIFLGRDYSRDFLVRINGNDMQGTLGRLANFWKQRIPDRPFNYHFLDEDYNKLYLAEQRSSEVFGVAAGLAIVLACLGLFGLAAFTTVQRTKEIGIRRVLGANVSSITFLVARNFLQLVVISILIAVPLAWWAGNRWLQDFAFRIPVSLSIFVITALATILLTLCTVGFHAVKAAWMNPVKSLRSE